VFCQGSELCRFPFRSGSPLRGHFRHVWWSCSSVLGACQGLSKNRPELLNAGGIRGVVVAYRGSVGVRPPSIMNKKAANSVDSEREIVILLCSALDSAPTARDSSHSGRRETWWGIVLPAGVAQLAEQLICNQQVDGSSPPASSEVYGQMRYALCLGQVAKWLNATDCKSVGSGLRRFESFPAHAGVTQLVESQPSKLLVAGSSPVSRSTSHQPAVVRLLIGG
jgi:hypothetical protein